MKLKFTDIKLIFNNINECQSGRNIDINLSNLIVGHEYQLTLSKVKNEGSLEFALIEGENSTVFASSTDGNSHTLTFTATQESSNLTVLGKYNNIPAFVLSATIEDLTESQEDAEDFITIICDPTAILPSATPTSTATPTPTSTVTPTTTVSSTIDSAITNRISIYDRSKNLRLEEKLLKNELGTEFWALSDIEDMIEQIPGKSDIYLKKPNENVLFKLEKYTTDETVETININVVNSDNVLLHNNISGVSGGGNPNSPVITGSYSLNYRNIVLIPVHDGIIKLKIAQEAPNFDLNFDGRIQVKVNGVVVETSGNAITANRDFDSQGEISLTVNKDDQISFTFVDTNETTSIQLKANYQEEKAAFLIDGKVNPTLTLNKNYKYNFNINTGSYAFWIQTVAGELNIEERYNNITGKSSGQISIEIKNGEDINTLYYASDPSGRGAHGVINFVNTDFVKITDFILCPTPTPTITKTATNTPTISSTPTNTPTHTVTQTQTQTQTPTNTVTITNSPTFTPTVTNTSTVTSTITPSATDSKDARVYYMSDVIENVSDLPPDNDLIVPYKQIKNITVTRFTSDNRIVNNEFVFNCVGGGSFIVQLGNLTVNTKYRFKFTAVHENEKQYFTVEPNSEVFVAKEDSQNINIVAFYTGNSKKILIKFTIEEVESGKSEDEFFIFECAIPITQDPVSVDSVTDSEGNITFSSTDGNMNTIISLIEELGDDPTTQVLQLEGNTGDKIIVPSGYNYAYFIRDGEVLEQREVVQGEVLEFRSNILFGNKKFQQYSFNTQIHQIETLGIYFSGWQNDEQKPWHHSAIKEFSITGSAVGDSTDGSLKIETTVKQTNMTQTDDWNPLPEHARLVRPILWSPIGELVWGYTQPGITSGSNPTDYRVARTVKDLINPTPPIPTPLPWEDPELEWCHGNYVPDKFCSIVRSPPTPTPSAIVGNLAHKEQNILENKDEISVASSRIAARFTGVRIDNPLGVDLIVPNATIDGKTIFTNMSKGELKLKHNYDLLRDYLGTNNSSMLYDRLYAMWTELKQEKSQAPILTQDLLFNSLHVMSHSYEVPYGHIGASKYDYFTPDNPNFNTWPLLKAEKYVKQTSYVRNGSWSGNAHARPSGSASLPSPSFPEKTGIGAIAPSQQYPLKPPRNGFGISAKAGFVKILEYSFSWNQLAITPTFEIIAKPPMVESYDEEGRWIWNYGNSLTMPQHSHHHVFFDDKKIKEDGGYSYPWKTVSFRFEYGGGSTPGTNQLHFELGEYEIRAKWDKNEYYYEA